MVAFPYLVHTKISLSFFPHIFTLFLLFLLFYLFALVLLLEGVTYQLSSSVFKCPPKPGEHSRRVKAFPFSLWAKSSCYYSYFLKTKDILGIEVT